MENFKAFNSYVEWVLMDCFCESQGAIRVTMSTNREMLSLKYFHNKS